MATEIQAPPAPPVGPVPACATHHLCQRPGCHLRGRCHSCGEPRSVERPKRVRAAPFRRWMYQETLGR